MTEDTKPGPIMLDLEGTSLTGEERALLQHPLVGGVIYFSRNYESTKQISALSAEIRHIRPELLIAVDQEGGRVQRFREGYTRLPAMQRFLPLYRKNSQAALSLVKDCGWLMAAELLATGIDFSFAPVLDVDDNRCEIIADRSFSPKPEEVSALAGAWITGMKEAGMAATGKHFPGHGSVLEDSHHKLPVDDRSFGDIAAHDLIPFVTLLPQLGAIMPAHILFSDIDAENTVGFSEYWLRTILRQDLGFKGVIFSDDLAMEGAAVVGSFTDRARRAIQAGCDMVLICNQRQGVLEVLGASSVLTPQSPGGDLVSMKASSNSYSLDELKAEPRWQLTQQLVQTFS